MASFFDGWCNKDGGLDLPDLPLLSTVLDDNFTEEMDDCLLSPDERNEYLSPPLQKWIDIFCSSQPTSIKLDESKDIQWKIAKEEFCHVRKTVLSLLKVTSTNGIEEKLVRYFLGSDSTVGKILQDKLEISKEEYLQFLYIICVQSGHALSGSQLFDKHSLLKEHLPMTREEYNEIWKRMSEKKKLPKTSMTTGRRQRCIWQILEEAVNSILRDLSVTGKDGRISLALDDDKINAQFSKSASEDLFGLKYATHTRANRKGLIAHTAVSSGLGIPLGIVFERSKDSTTDCFKRLLDFLFESDGGTDLRNVSVHSDRGYLVPSIVFEYILNFGGDVVGTLKRSAGCWPFNFGHKKPAASDKRTMIDESGAPTLFLKMVKIGKKASYRKKVIASAFRNGTSNVVTAISSLHQGHEWEGVLFDNSEAILKKYNEDNTSLVDKCLERRSELHGIDENSCPEETNVINNLLQDKVVPFTLRQGKDLTFLQTVHPCIHSFSFSNISNRKCRLDLFERT